MIFTKNDAITQEPLLTIGIPTYNRPDRLEKCLSSVLHQATDNVEILVSDNSENDYSEAVVNKLNGIWDNKIKYIKNSTNVGLDKNFFNLVKYGGGKYFQWLSDDDELIEGAVNTIILKIKQQNSEPFFFFLNPIGFVEQDGKRLWKKPFFHNQEDYSGVIPEEAVEIFDHYITFVSAYCFNRKCWLSCCDHENFFGTNLYLTYALIAYLSNYKRTIITCKPLVAHRQEYTGNFPALSPFTVQLQNALIRHAKKCGLDYSRLEKSYVKVLKIHIFRILVGYKLGYFNSSHKNNFYKDIFIPCAGYTVFWYKFLPVLLTPSFIFRVAQCFKRRVKLMI